MKGGGALCSGVVGLEEKGRDSALRMYEVPAERMRGAQPPSISHAPPRFGSMEIDRMVPPVRIAYVRQTRRT
jgi:hypothetical protein